MTLDKAILKVSADVDGDGAEEDGEFHMVGNLEIQPGLRTGFIVDGQGGSVNSVIASLLGDGQSKRQAFYLDLGGGAHVVEIQFRGWEGATVDGSNLQWGNDASQSKTQASATGQDPLTQIDVLMRYLTIAEIDSRNPATLEYGEYSADGLYDPLDVVVEGPTMTDAAQDGPSYYDGTMTCISTADLTDMYDAKQRPRN